MCVHRSAPLFRTCPLAASADIAVHICGLSQAVTSRDPARKVRSNTHQRHALDSLGNLCRPAARGPCRAARRETKRPPYLRNPSRAPQPCQYPTSQMPHAPRCSPPPPQHPQLRRLEAARQLSRILWSQAGPAAAARHRASVPLDGLRSLSRISRCNAIAAARQLRLTHPSHFKSPIRPPAESFGHPQRSQEATTPRRHAARHQQVRENQTPSHRPPHAAALLGWWGTVRAGGLLGRGASRWQDGGGGSGDV